TGRLYAANNLGAVVGGLLASFLLIGSIGLAATTMLAQMVNFAVAALALAADRALPAAAPPAEERGPESCPSGPARPIALRSVLASGFAAMLFEVALMKLLPVILGSSVYAFSLMVASFITGIGLGSWFAAVALSGAGASTLGVAQLAAGLAFLASLPLYNRL